MSKSTRLFRRLFFLSGWLSALWFVAFGCQQTQRNPGINGRIELGRERFMSSSARRILIAAYKATDFDKVKGFLKPGSVPIGKTEITSLNSPPYLFQLDIPTVGVEVVLLAFADQDNSGGEIPSAKDLYGFYPADPSKEQPILLSGYRLENIRVELSKIFEKPTIPIEILLSDNIKSTPNTKFVFFGMWRVSDVGDGMIPIKDTTPLIKYEIKDLAATRWTFRVDSGNVSTEVIPFVYIDLDGSGAFSKGDGYAIWNQKPIDLDKIREDIVQLNIKLVYEP